MWIALKLSLVTEKSVASFMDQRECHFFLFLVYRDVEMYAMLELMKSDVYYVDM